MQRRLIRMLLALAITAAAAPSLAVELGDPAQGLAFAEDNCAECHAVVPGDYDSPHLGAPGFTEIANVPAMSELALFSFFQTPHQTMPNFVLETSDIRDVIAYIRSLRSVD